MDVWRRTFEVNLFGHIAITQALLPALLPSSGRVVNITSLGGKIALPAAGAYSAAKFALEAVSDSLRREVAPLGVQVVVVEPGAVRTEMVNSGTSTTKQLAAGMTREQTGKVRPPHGGDRQIRRRVHRGRGFRREGRACDRPGCHRPPPPHPLHRRPRGGNDDHSLPHPARPDA
jgi:NAD(P)-dependent dehydrogenase (short-subunit alcohol dehydrogenase family)